MTLADVLERIGGGGGEVAHVGLFDLFGTFRERRVRVADIPDVFGDGASFVNVLPAWDASEAVFGAGPFLGEPVCIDPRSLRGYPFEPNAFLLLAEYAGPSADLSPRVLLERQIERAAALGFEPRTAFEFEFLVLEHDAAGLRARHFTDLESFARDNRCWAGESAAVHGELIVALETALAAGDLDLLSLGLELGPGCFEATLRAREPLRAADDAAVFKLFTKAFFRRRNLTASFMAQLGAEFPGLSGHVHLSLLDRRSGRNLFFDESDPEAMSKRFKHFVAGLVELAPQAMALTHHTVNAYRRHAPGNWAPKTASWAVQDYAAGTRVVSSAEAACRLEYRLPGADTNPYLALAFVLGAGLWGIENERELPPPLVGGGPHAVPEAATALPHDLLMAAERIERSAIARSLWGDRFIEHLVCVCRVEDAALRRATSDAERARYLELA